MLVNILNEMWNLSDINKNIVTAFKFEVFYEVCKRCTNIADSDNLKEVKLNNLIPSLFTHCYINLILLCYTDGKYPGQSI